MSSWKTVRLGNVAQTLVPQRDKPKDLSGPIPWLRIEDFAGKHVSKSKTGQGVTREQVSELNMRVFPRRTVLTTCSCNMGSTAIADAEIITNQTFIGILPDERIISSDFLYYVLISRRQELQAQATGAIQQYLSRDDFRRVRFQAPDLTQQQKIADFLDCETAKIDALIEKQADLIRGLQARRRAVIRHAVLGRDKPPFKAVNVDSPWVPEVPSAWEFVPLGYRYEVVLGKMLDAGRAPRADDAELPYIRAANIQETGLDLSSVNSMPFTPLEAAKFSLRVRDLLVVEGGSVGVSVVLGQDMDGWGFQKTVNRVRALDGSSTYFLHYVLNAYKAAGVFSIVCGGSTIAHLTAEKLAALRIPFPPFDEQCGIVEHLDREIDRIDTLITKSEQLIELSQERRSALITAAVTGQIDVREMEFGKEAA